MNLRKLVQDHVAKLGYGEASLFFGKSIPTLKSWASSGTIPITAAQQVLDLRETMDEALAERYPGLAMPGMQAETQAGEHPGDTTIAAPQMASPNSQDFQWQLNKLSERVAVLENSLATSKQSVQTADELEPVDPVFQAPPSVAPMKPLISMVPAAGPTEMISKAIPPQDQPVAPPTIPTGAGDWNRARPKLTK